MNFLRLYFCLMVCNIVITLYRIYNKIDLNDFDQKYNYTEKQFIINFNDDYEFYPYGMLDSEWD